MTSVLLVQNAPAADAPALTADFAAAGFEVMGPVDCAHLVREALRAGPNVVACWAPRADDELFRALRLLQEQQATPVLVFTQDTSAEALEQALECGVHEWVVRGYGAERLRPLVQLALAREARERKLRDALADLSHRFEERKLVDKAKGILMRSSRMSEDEAFQLLRTASMQGNQRVGQVSRQVIDAAQVAEAINRAGQQRMLSQRIVKLYALACARADAPAAALLLKQSAQRVDDNLAALGKLSAATYGDLLAQVQSGWAPVRRIVGAPPQPAQLAELDALAEAMLGQADALVAALEASGLATTVGTVNLAGRQRMLSQRLAKQALLAALGPADARRALDAAVVQTAQALEEGLAALAASPLSTPQIRQGLDDARRNWEVLRQAAAHAATASGRLQLAAASEDLLAVFEDLTGAYQHSIQVLMG